MASPVGIYVSVPFCRSKCTFCNFASEAFPPARMQDYVARLTQEIQESRALSATFGYVMPDVADSVYLGGGTPSLLQPAQLTALFAATRQHFAVAPDAEVTMEAAPGQISPELLDAALQAGVNRISLGVQSFVDAEAKAVGRLHTADVCRKEIKRLQTAGVPRLSVDLIAGLPFQNAISWSDSLQQVHESGVEHVSVYMLETDGDSRLGTEVERLRATSQLTVLGEHARYHASSVPSDEACTDLYLQACDKLAAYGLEQYEISNFARPGAQSRHNRKYWERAPYVGFGLDAHSMLPDGEGRAFRFQNADELNAYLVANGPSETVRVTDEQAFEEAVFLGLRLLSGVPLRQLAAMHQPAALRLLEDRARELAAHELLTIENDHIALTARGRVLSSSVFGELLTGTA